MRRVHPVSQPSDTDYVSTVRRYHASSTAKKIQKMVQRLQGTFSKPFFSSLLFILLLCLIHGGLWVYRLGTMYPKVSNLQICSTVNHPNLLCSAAPKGNKLLKTRLCIKDREQWMFKCGTNPCRKINHSLPGASVFVLLLAKLRIEPSKEEFQDERDPWIAGPDSVPLQSTFPLGLNHYHCHCPRNYSPLNVWISSEKSLKMKQVKAAKCYWGTK